MYVEIPSYLDLWNDGQFGKGMINRTLYIWMEIFLFAAQQGENAFCELNLF